MSVEHHTLTNDLPEYKELIRELKTSDAHFVRLMNDYHALTTKIETIENSGNAVSDENEMAMKQQRVHLKDELVQILEKKKDGCCGRADCGCKH